MSLAFQYLRSDIIRSPTNSLLLLLIILQLGGQSKISKLDFQVIIEKQIPEFQAASANIYSRWMTLFCRRYIKAETICQR